MFIGAAVFQPFKVNIFLGTGKLRGALGQALSTSMKRIGVREVKIGLDDRPAQFADQRLRRGPNRRRCMSSFSLSSGRAGIHWGASELRDGPNPWRPDMCRRYDAGGELDRGRGAFALPTEDRLSDPLWVDSSRRPRQQCALAARFLSKSCECSTPAHQWPSP